MSLYILTKSGIQCRSHHQKFETKYKFPHRIIKEERSKLDPELYLELQRNF
jgi:hypothetical protein